MKKKPQPTQGGKKPENKPEKKVDPTIVTHHEARRDYFIIESMECGIVLKGPEVKSLRDAKAGLSGSFARFEKGELYIYNMYIAPYEKASIYNPAEPTHPRKLLLHRDQLEKLHDQMKQKGLALIPLKAYWNKNGIAKIELGLAKGKKQYDKRADIKKENIRRDIDRAIKNRNRR